MYETQNNMSHNELCEDGEKRREVLGETHFP